jgi:molecular chaperone DnaK (HSP70)
MVTVTCIPHLACGFSNVQFRLDFGVILAGDEGANAMVPIDANPLALGIETTGGAFTKLIPRNTSIPTRKGQM